MLHPMSSPEPDPPIEPAEVSVEPAGSSPRWGWGQRVLFRFTFSYLLLFVSTYLLMFFAFAPPFSLIPFLGALASPYLEIWDVLVPWAGRVFFAADASVLPNASGDTTYSYVQVFCFLMLALIATAVWTLLDRRRASYARLHEWLRVYVRFALAFWMIGYGAAKVIPLQVSHPPLDRLLQPFGDASPEGLFWTFMGASFAYTIFAGVGEMLGGLLLVARRTTLLGALVCAVVLLHVVVLNLSYDVPVKLFSIHLLAMALFLAARDLRRLADLLVFNRAVEPVPIRPLFARVPLHRGALVLRSVLVFGLATFLLVRGAVFTQQRSQGPKPPLYGLWTVEEFVVDGQTRPPLFTDETRWQRVVFDEPGVLAILTGNSRQRFDLASVPGPRRLQLTRRFDPDWKSELSYRKLAPDLLAFEGTFDGHAVRARLRRAEVPAFRLTSRGFHWINEYPYSY